jgi:calcineurin-like phosphoesterase family protein
MLQQLKFKTSEQNVFFTSDLHYGHNKDFVWKARGFSSLSEHDEFIIKSINDTVGQDDILWSLGDMTLNTNEEQFESFISRLNCKKIYSLWGNHPNPMAKIYKEKCMTPFWGTFFDDGTRPEIYPFVYKNLIFCGHYAEIFVDKQFIVCSHYPIAVHNNSGHGSWACCGHSHHGFEGSLPNNSNGKILDVGFDGFKKPLSFAEIQKIMSHKIIIKSDHH